MNAVNFPNMIKNNKTVIIKDKAATEQNLKLLLNSVKNTLLGDPYFGVNLQRFIYERNNAVLKDLLIDEVYTAVSLFIPQLRMQRKDIDIEANGKLVLLYITAQNVLDFKFDEYTINLLNLEEK